MTSISTVYQEFHAVVRRARSLPLPNNPLRVQGALQLSIVPEGSTFAVKAVLSATGVDSLYERDVARMTMHLRVCFVASVLNIDPDFTLSRFYVDYVMLDQVTPCPFLKPSH